MPDLRFECPACQQHIAAPEELACQSIECPNCQAAITIPAGDAPAQPTRRPKLWLRRALVAGCLALAALGMVTFGRSSWGKLSKGWLANDKVAPPAEVAAASPAEPQKKKRKRDLKKQRAEAMTPPPATARGLDTTWVTLAEATSQPYYRRNVRSDPVQAHAIALLAEIERTGGDNQRKAAAGVTEILGRERVAAADRERTSFPQGKLAGLQNELLFKGMTEPGKFGAAYEQYVKDGAKAITQWAVAQQQIANQRFKLQQHWGDTILPAISAAAGPETDRPLVEVQTEHLVRDLWIMARNVSGGPLSNCTLTIRFTQGDGDKFGPAELTCFVREWPANETIYPAYSHCWISLRIGEVSKGDQVTRVKSQFWCDQGRSAQRAVPHAKPYAIRDAFAHGIVREGAKYVHFGPNRWELFEFASVRQIDNRYYAVEATVRTELANDPGHASVQTYRGFWDERPNEHYPVHPGGVRVRLGKPGEKSPRNWFDWSGTDYTFNGLPGLDNTIFPLPDAAN